MFCPKCGMKAIDGAFYCQKCGAKLIQENREEREPVPVSRQESVEKSIPSVGATSESEHKSVKGEETVLEGETILVPSSELVKMSAFPTGPIVDTTRKIDNPKESSSTSGSDADIYALLKENINMCPAIKSAKQFKKGVCMRGKIYSHSVRLVTVHTVQARLRSVLAFPFSILYGLLVGFLCSITGILFQEFIKYGSICREYYHGILLALCCLVAGAIVLIHTLVGRKEKDAVENYVREIVESKQIYLSERKWVGAPAKKIAAAIVLVVAGIIILPLSLPEPVEYPDELLFDGLPAVRFLEMTQKDVELEFGEKEMTGKNGITADDYYNYSSSAIEHVTYSKETGKVIYIEFWGSHCSYNRKNLDRSMERVLDILTEGDWYCVDPRRYAYEVYGSIHSGFYYHDGEYISEYVGADWRWRHGLEGSTHYQVFPLHTYGQKDYKIALTTVRWENDDRPLELYKVCLYTDEWVELVNATTVSHEQTYTNEGDLCYGEVPLIDLLYKSEDEVCNILGFPTSGTPVNGELLFGGEYYAYKGLALYFDDRTDSVVEISVQPDLVKINGETLDKNRAGLISLLGQPTYEDYYYDESGEFDDCYYMQYTLYEAGVIIDIEMPNPEGKAYSATIYEYNDGPTDDY